MKKVHQKLVNTHILNSCFSKVPYETESEALQASEKIASENYLNKGRNKRAMRPYHCDVCSNYHLTKLTERGFETGKRRKLGLNNYSLRKKGKRKK